MKETKFIDTSVLLEILEVQHCCKNSKKYQQELVEFYGKENATLIMPISVLIETGNHINHIPDKVMKMDALKKFIDILELFLNSKKPWVFYGYNFGVDDISRIKEQYAQVVSAKVGIGDVFILDAYYQYIEKLKADASQNHLISIWSLDEHLSAYSQEI